MKNVVNCRDKQDAIDCAALLKRYFPRDVLAIVDMHGKWGYVQGKTRAKINKLARKGYPVFILNMICKYNYQVK